jgi:hypothetical protein
MMKKLTWAKITAGMVLSYGTFLIVQVLVDVWPTETAHEIAMFAGGVFLILWGLFFIARTSR